MGSEATAERDGILAPGSRFVRYTVERLLGKGGMGAVYLMHGSDGRRFAVKVMFPDVAARNPEFRSRFAREAEFAMKVRHRNLIPVHAAGEDAATGLCYLVMDYMPGGSLSERLANGKRLSVEESVIIVSQVADALEAAHRSGIIHRDVKPDNILFDADGTPKLADLGVAKFTDGAKRTTVTVTGMVIGTPAYMAPEQMIDSRHIDSRADIYALGVVFYEMLTGMSPRKDSSAVELLAKALKGDPIPDVRERRPDVPEALAYVISQMCAPRPEARPSTPHAVVKLLKRAMEGKLSVPKIAPRRMVPRRRVFQRILAWSLGIVAFGAVAYGLLGKGGWLHPYVQIRTNTVERVVEKVVKPASGLVDTSRLDPIRYVNMSDRELFAQMLTVDVNGSIKRDIEISGGIDKFARRTGTLSATRRKNMVNIFICRDALEMMNLPKPVTTAILERVVYHGAVSDIPLGQLLDAFPKMTRKLRSRPGHLYSSSQAYMVAVFLDCLPQKPKAKKAKDYKNTSSTESTDRSLPSGEEVCPERSHESRITVKNRIYDIGVLRPVANGIGEEGLMRLWKSVEDSVRSTQHNLVWSGSIVTYKDIKESKKNYGHLSTALLLKPHFSRKGNSWSFWLEAIDALTGKTTIAAVVKGDSANVNEGGIAFAVKYCLQ